MASEPHASLLPLQPPVRTPPAVDLEHRDLLDGEFWRHIPAYRDVDANTFADHHWQAKHSVTRVVQLTATLRGLVPASFYDALEAGLARSPMSLRVTPYILSLIDWSDANRDPLRRQFLPLSREQLPDHPRSFLDTTLERAYSPVDGLTHRYPDRALFVTQDRCPVYCRYCTRSYTVGLDTAQLGKVHVSASTPRWDRVFDYLRAHPEIEDVLISGGDAFSLRADQLQHIGDNLLAIPHVRRVRVATKGIAVMPMKLLTDLAWFDALAQLAERGRAIDKAVVVHTHFSHPRECTDFTRRTMQRLFAAGITTRNQHVLLRGVNDHPDVMRMLIRRLGYLNVQPYYVFQHDMVRGVEDLRTALHATIEIEKHSRGCTSGYHTPTFVIDTPGGGGKRDVHAYEHYNQVTGVSVYRSPNMDPDAHYVHFDPIDTLPIEGQALWSDPRVHNDLVADAISKC